MTSSDQEFLRKLCAEFDIDTEYWDIWGRQHQTSIETCRRILSSLGLSTGTPEDLQASAQEHRRRRLGRLVDPVSVVSAEAEGTSIAVRLPLALTSQKATTVSAAVYWEDGSSQRFDFPVEALNTKERFDLDGEEYVALQLPLPTPLPLGYHNLEVAIETPGHAALRGEQRLIAAPDRAWLPDALDDDGRLAGLAVSLYGVRSQRNWGAGDFTDLKAVVRWVAEDLGAAFVALNPLHALHNRQPYNTSPYLPLSSYYRNMLYLDVESVEDFASCPLAQRAMQRPWFQHAVAELRASEFVEYEWVARLKTLFLRFLFRRFVREELDRDTPRAKAFRKWRAAEGKLLEQFATYCALDEWLHRKNPDLWIWPDWPEEYRDPESSAVREFQEEHRGRLLFFAYVQWQIDLQLTEVQAIAQQATMPIGLYHDLALATDSCGSDLWAHRSFFATGCRVGAPPDDFAPEGQDWAFPPPNSERHREDGYRLFVESIRKNSKHGGALRIDHVMRFFRLFWIPDGLPAREGTYVNEPWQDLLRILALESVRGRFLIVGEDLGTVPPALREAMEQFRMLSYKLFWFEKGEDGLPRRIQDYALHALVSSTTHDLPTLAGFWAFRDIDARRDAEMIGDEADYQRRRQERADEKRKMIEALIRDGFLPQDFPRDAAWWTELTGELHNAIIGYLVSTPSQLMLLNQEDLTKEPDQQNLPGTTWQYPNWRRKMRLTVEELQGSRARDFARMFRAWLERTGRLNPAEGTAVESPRTAR